MNSIRKEVITINRHCTGVRQAAEKYYESLARLAFSYTKNMPDAQDIVQDVFLCYMKKYRHFNDDEHEKAWLIRVTVNKCRDFHRRRKKQTELSCDIPASENETNYEILNAVLSLDEKYRVPIHLYYYEGYSIKEISRILKIKESTVGSRLARARRLLKSEMEEQI